MKRAIFLICILVIALTVFVVPSFAVDTFDNQPFQNLDYAWCSFNGSDRLVLANSIDVPLYCFYVPTGGSYNKGYIVVVSDVSFSVPWIQNSENGTGSAQPRLTYDGSYLLYYGRANSGLIPTVSYVPEFNSVTDGLAAVRDYIDNPPSQITKNAHVDEFIANTLISMGYTFQTSGDALRIASAAWDWCTDENNIGTGGYDWSIDTFASYCNAQSNNYLDWYLGYKVHSDVVKALKAYSVNNLYNDGALTGGIAGFDETYDYSPKRPADNAFYPAQTITYFNGQYLSSDGISSEQFTLTPPAVRSFLGSPSTVVPQPTDSSGTGEITDGNGDKVYDIDIEFPSLEWLGQALQAIADALKSLLDTVSTLLSKLIDAVQALFSDAFESLSTFGEGIIEWIKLVAQSLQGLMNSYFPSDISAILFAFLCLNIGIGIIKFILRAI